MSLLDPDMRREIATGTGQELGQRRVSQLDQHGVARAEGAERDHPTPPLYPPRVEDPERLQTSASLEQEVAKRRRAVDY